MGFKTDAIHAGQEPDPTTGAVTIPIYQTSTYVQEGLGKHKGYDYARTQNPTRMALEKNMAVLERGVAGYAFASGMAATTALTHLLLKQGDHAICSENVYGGTFRLFDKIVRHYGVEFSYVTTSDPEAVRNALRPNTRMLFIETPTNPVMAISDIRALSDIAHANNTRVVVDNTFMSPYFQRPLELGADQFDDVIRVPEAVRGAMKRDEAAAAIHIVEQGLGLRRFDPIDVGVNDQGVVFREVRGVQVVGILRIGDLDPSIVEDWDELIGPFPGNVVAPVAKEERRDRPGGLGLATKERDRD